MVIINNRDDYLSFLKVPGVRMQTAVVSNNNSSTTTLTRDSQVQQQVQQQQQQNNNNNNNNIALQNNTNGSSNNNNGINSNGVNVNNNNNNNNINNNNGLPGLAKAVLICRQNSHPFNNRTLFLEPHQEVKVGRSVARNRVSENNAIFDCKVLSRNHAVLWYNDGKFFIKDTGSSNGTFINNVRLSQTSTESEPYEVSSGDIVQFGVDVMENTRRETHGCIVATLKLFLPDGRETKASQSIGVGGQSTKIPPVDLYRLNQYIQEANQREQILETKLTSLQKMVEATKQNSALGWQAMIDEDRLLSRIDMLEKKLQYFQKGMTDDKLREEVLKLQDEKYQYQNSAKETLWKVHQERLDATHKLTAIEKALCSSEDECSFLREQLSKTQLQLQEVTGRLDALQNQYDERVSAGEEQLKAKESEVSNLSHEINLLQEKISFYAFYASDEDDQQQQQQEYNNSAVSDWLLKSDIKKLEGSEDIIKAICNDAEADANSDEKEINLEDSVMQLQKRIMTLERNISLFMENDSRVENENNEPNDNASVTSTSTTNTTVPGAVSNDNAADPATIADGEECDGNQNVQNATGESDSQPSTNETTTTTTTAAVTIANSNADQPQQNPPKRSSSGTKLPAHLSCELNQNVLRRNLKHIKSECALLLRQVSKVREDNRKSDDSVVAKVKYDELEGELRTLKQELESRPRSDELDKKQQQCDSLSENLATLRIEADELRALNDRCQDEMERMENELLKQKNMENEKHSAMAALHKQEAFSVEEVVAVGKAEEEAVPTKAIEVASVETQTEVEEPVVFSADVSESDVSICSNLGELDEDDDDDEEDDDEKTETIDTTEIFVGQKLLQLNESGLETTDSATSNSHSISISSSPNDSNLSVEDETTPVTVTGGGEPNGSILERVENLPLESSSIEHELELINHPDVQREEELIAFKEKYTHLTQENIRLNQQLQKLSDDFSHFKSKSVMNLLMYIAPVIVIIGYLLFNRVVS
ncbi:sarcolemmal membrane-associated protein-like [Culex pipiens pallens]|uniref:sarcolemmal membrane-associated protein-like n=1 Tax=Culex pipiens pallens TaxID=42434 RepID=UPI001952D584|nr:sarcolemmal membrane-associated protein-like [Culex pipiens pallens]XP_039434468.1 sarcolemmal membrane-associated protein-like [Culex pipiens pallens]